MYLPILLYLPICTFIYLSVKVYMHLSVHVNVPVCTSLQMISLRIVCQIDKCCEMSLYSSETMVGPYPK